MLGGWIEFMLLRNELFTSRLEVLRQPPAVVAVDPAVLLLPLEWYLDQAVRDSLWLRLLVRSSCDLWRLTAGLLQPPSEEHQQNRKVLFWVHFGQF